MRREDTPGWKKDFFSLSFRLTNAKTGQGQVLSTEALREFCRALGASSWLGRILRLGRIGKLLG